MLNNAKWKCVHKALHSKIFFWLFADLNRPCRVKKVPISGLQKQCLEETKAKLPLPPELSHLDQSSEIDETDAEMLIKKEPIDPSETEFRHSIFD